MFRIFLFCFEVFCPLFWKVHDARLCGYFRLTAVFPVSSWGMLLTQQNGSSNRQEAVQARLEIKQQFLPRPSSFHFPTRGHLLKVSQSACQKPLGAAGARPGWRWPPARGPQKTEIPEKKGPKQPNFVFGTPRPRCPRCALRPAPHTAGALQLSPRSEQ